MDNHKEAEIVAQVWEMNAETERKRAREKNEIVTSWLWTANVFGAGVFDAAAIVLSVILGTLLANKDATASSFVELALGIVICTGGSAVIKHRAK